MHTPVAKFLYPVLLASLALRLSACQSLPSDDWLNSAPNVVEQSQKVTLASNCGPGRRTQGLC